MKMIKALDLRAHVGVQMGPTVLTSIHHEKNKAEMYLWEEGVLVALANGDEYLIPYGMLGSVKLEKGGIESLIGKLPVEPKKAVK